jgi:glycosyltransferase involved in cell wall biosynthesis
MKILFTTQALSIGGIEVIALRFSEAFSKEHEVTLYDFNPDRRNEQLIAQFNTSLFTIAGMQPGKLIDKLIWKTNAVLFKTKLLLDFRQRLIERHFKKFIQTNNFDIVCSLSFHQDYLSCKYCRLKGTPVVVSMHGTYEYAAPEWQARAKLTYEYARAFTYLADKNIEWYKQQDYYNPYKPCFKIYNGIDIKKPVPKIISRADLGIGANDFVFVMVARGIAEKGWKEAIEAFQRIHSKFSATALLLVGDGEYLQQLKANSSQKNGIIFYGFHPNPIELIQLANVGLLPTYFPIESLPNVIVDYLLCRLPVIATDMGEIREMLRWVEDEYAGTVLSLPSSGAGVGINSLQEAMMHYVVDSKFYNEKIRVAKQVIHKFDINDCVSNYMKVFDAVLSE